VDTRTATVIIRFRAPDGTWKRATAPHGADGRIKPGFARVNGKVQEVRQYQYQVRYYEQRKLRYEAVGTNAADAEDRRRIIQMQTSAKAVAEAAGLRVEPIEEKERTLSQSAQAYIRDARGRRANEAALQAEAVTSEFLRLIKKSHIDQVKREDILRYHDSLRTRGLSDRTIANKHARLKSWLRFAGAEDTIFPPAPKYEKKLPTVYTAEQLTSILNAADPYMRLVIGLALKCGLRDQELVFLEWSDINEHDKVLRVQGKEQWGFKVKDSEQRELPIPDDLLKELKARKAKCKKHRLVLGTATDQPNTKLLRTLKKLAKHAGLNCQRCAGCSGRLKECREWTLHRFRRTFGTTLLRAGVDLRTVQSLMGHEDLDSTLRYLRPATGTQLRTRINSMRWGA